MTDINRYEGSLEEVTAKVLADIGTEAEPDDYTAELHIGNITLLYEASVDLGGGFEGGYAYTRLSSTVPVAGGFKFAIHHETFVDEIGKFFGMQDVELGYEEFDRKVVVKTNDADSARLLFNDPRDRSYFTELDDYSFGIHHPREAAEGTASLELFIENYPADQPGVSESLRVFHSILSKLQGESA
jgi:hypothetical protein